LSNKNENITDSFNIVVELGSEKNPKYFDKILKLLNLNCREVNLVKIEKETNITIIYYRVTFENADNIKNLMDILDKEFNEIKFSLYENKILN
jgi:hypothetical protein